MSKQRAPGFGVYECVKRRKLLNRSLGNMQLLEFLWALSKQLQITNCTDTLYTAVRYHVYLIAHDNGFGFAVAFQIMM